MGFIYEEKAFCKCFFVLVIATSAPSLRAAQRRGNPASRHCELRSSEAIQIKNSIPYYMY
jgi:hypothetical protein